MRIDIGVEIPPLPEGFEGTPDELFEFFKENAIFVYDGEFPTGQIGGTRPTQDSGIWYGDEGIEKWKDGAYHPITDVPIGCVLPYAGPEVAPPNYLLCNGKSYAKSAYPELANAIGVVWGPGDNAPTTFNVPDMRGRGPIGIGIGDYVYQGLTGKMSEVYPPNGSATDNKAYAGFEWPTTPTVPPGAPVKSMKTTNKNFLLNSIATYESIRPPSVAMQWIIRAR